MEHVFTPPIRSGSPLAYAGANQPGQLAARNAAGSSGTPETNFRQQPDTTGTMVEVFKTNVRQRAQARQLLHLLNQHFPACKINFDLEDCDKILRMEGTGFRAGQVMQLVQAQGFHCGILE